MKQPSNGKKRNGHGVCPAHPQAEGVCRLCVLASLHQFRAANFRAGLKLAMGKIRALQSTYADRSGSELRAHSVAADLGILLAKLQGTSENADELSLLEGMPHARSKPNRSDQIPLLTVASQAVAL